LRRISTSIYSPAGSHFSDRRPNRGPRYREDTTSRTSSCERLPSAEKPGYYVFSDLFVFQKFKHRSQAISVADVFLKFNPSAARWTGVFLSHGPLREIASRPPPPAPSPEPSGPSSPVISGQASRSPGTGKSPSDLHTRSADIPCKIKESCQFQTGSSLPDITPREPTNNTFGSQVPSP
jgi:hypothetical protein